MQQPETSHDMIVRKLKNKPIIAVSILVFIILVSLTALLNNIFDLWNKFVGMDINKAEQIAKIHSAPNSFIYQSKEDLVVQLPVSTTPNPTPHKPVESNSEAIDSVNKLLYKLESAFKQRNLLMLQSCFSDSNYAVQFQDYWDLPRSTPEIKLTLLGLTKDVQSENGFTAEVELQIKEYGSWKPVGPKKLRFVTIQNNWKIDGHDMLQ